MSVDRRLFRFFMFASLACAASTAHATLTFYSTQNSFAAAASATAVDTFSGIGAFGSQVTVNRTVGDDSYRIWSPAAVSGKTLVLVLQSDADPAIGSFFYGMPLVIDNFSSADPSTPVQAIGGNFFNTGSGGTYRSGSITLTALDSDGTSLTRTFSGRASSFEGFVTTATLVSLTIAPASASSHAGYAATVDNLRLGSNTVTAVPEPENYALLLAGIGAVGTIARRRRTPR